MKNCGEVISQSGASFGTSGVRGLVEDLDDATCFAFTLAFLGHLIAESPDHKLSKIWVGHDLRPSSPKIANAVLSAVEHLKLEPVFCGEIATPALAYSSITANQPAIMITGSHIPFDRNGIKFYRPDGEMTKEDESFVTSSKTEFPDELFEDLELTASGPRRPADRSAHNAWHQRYQTAFGGLLSEMRIGHYQHSAAGRDDLTQLLETLGATVVPLDRSETFIPIDTEAVSEADLLQAKAWSIKHNLDALISTDGDGDRPLLADENGTYLRGDTLGILTTMALNAEAVVTPVSSNTALEKCGSFKTIGRTKIGSPHVIAEMETLAKENNLSVVGFEANGGFLTATELKSPWKDVPLAPLPTRDSVLPILATIALAKLKKMQLSELSSLLPQRVTSSDRLVETDKEVSEKLLVQFSAGDLNPSALSDTGSPLATIDTTDGMRFTFQDDSIVHLRPSGNAPELRIYVETSSQNASDQLLSHAKEVVKTLLG